ncbi:hypothetical protein, partial [Pseudomonas sp. FEN]
ARRQFQNSLAQWQGSDRLFAFDRDLPISGGGRQLFIAGFSAANRKRLEQCLGAGQAGQGLLLQFGHGHLELAQGPGQLFRRANPRQRAGGDSQHAYRGRRPGARNRLEFIL